LILKKFSRDIFRRIFALGIFWGWVKRFVFTTLIVALSLCHSDLSTSLLRSPVATGTHLDRTEKIPKYVQTTGTVEVFDPRSGILGPK
jgi:hypothetical protein